MFLQSSVSFLILSLIVVRKLFPAHALFNRLLVSFQGWIIPFEEGEVATLIDAYRGETPAVSQEVALHALRSKKYRKWHSPLNPSSLPIEQDWWRRYIDQNPNANMSKWWNYDDLLNLLAVCSLAPVALVLVGGFECARGLDPSYHLTLLLTATLVTAILSLLLPVIHTGWVPVKKEGGEGGEGGAPKAPNSTTTTPTPTYAPTLELQISLWVGGGMGLVSLLTLTYMYASSYSTTTLPKDPIPPSQAPWVDLGAPLGPGLARAGLWAAPLVIAGTTLFTGLLGVVFFIPALRTAKYFSYRLMASAVGGASAAVGEARARGGVEGWLAWLSPIAARAGARLWLYAPALTAALWCGPLVTLGVIPWDAVPCTPAAASLALEGGYKGDLTVARDCRGNFPGLGPEGGEGWRAWVPQFLFTALSSTLSSSPSGAGNGGGGSSSSSITPTDPATAYLAWVTGHWVGESSWLRWRACAALCAGGALLWQWRELLQSHLDESWGEAGRLLKRTGRELVKGGRGKDMRLSSGEMSGVLTLLERARCKGPLLLPLAALQLLAVPVILMTLALLMTRGGGAGGSGLCRTAVSGLGVGESALGYAPGTLIGSALAAAGFGGRGRGGFITPAAFEEATGLGGVWGGGWDDYVRVCVVVAGKVGGKGLGDAMGEAFKLVGGVAASTFHPSLWRPLLSYLTLAALAIWFVEVEVALMYWRVWGGPSEEGEDEEEEVSKLAAEAAAVTGGGGGSGGGSKKGGVVEQQQATGGKEEEDDFPKISQGVGGSGGLRERRRI